MNESRLQVLIQALQDGALNEDECQERIEWFDEHELRRTDFVDHLWSGDVKSATHLSASEVIPSEACDSLRQAKPMDGVSRQVRERIESRADKSIADDSSRSANHPLAFVPKARRVRIAMSA